MSRKETVSQPAEVPGEVFRLGRRFGLHGRLVEAIPCGRGHINDTFRASYHEGGRVVRCIHQRVNREVFRDPIALMGNIETICRHLSTRMPRAPGLVPAENGRPYWIDDSGDFWRTFEYVEGAETVDVLGTPGQAYEAGRAFGEFQAMLADLPPERLVETIPGFHHTGMRLETLVRTVETDPAGRVAGAGPEIEFAFARGRLARVLQEVYASAEVPVRITHNDAKPDNVLFDASSGKAVCVIDLDTVMPGRSLDDFGDLVRAALSHPAEDTGDVASVSARPEIVGALARGFLAAAGSLLTRVEREHLVTAGIVIAYELGVRFLTDFLQGDRYFKTARPQHNLDRARVQFAVACALEAREPELGRLVAALCAEAGH